MPRLACWTCGRQIYTVAPLEELFREERRCPRCGAFLRPERRETERRLSNRRVNPPNDPGPPESAKGSATAKGKARATGGTPASTSASASAGADPRADADAPSAETGGERRTTDRRTTRRRRDWNEHPRGSGNEAGGWQD